MKSLKQRLGGVAVLLSVALAGCMTFEATLPGTLDMRKELAQPPDAPLEPARPAFGDTDDSFFDGMVFTESTDAPTRGEHLAGAKAEASIYRRVMRQWFIIYLFPILADPDLVTTDLKAELAQPGTRATNIRITSGIDLVDFGRYLVGIIIGPLNLVPTRTTEVIAYIEKPGDTSAPAAAPPPAETTTPTTPDTPAAPGTTTPTAEGGDTPTTPPPPDSPNLPDAPITGGGK